MKTDRRVRYTKMIIRHTLLKLMETMPINKITVKHICELSDISRGTFYAHYFDVYDLIEQITNEFLEKIDYTFFSSYSYHQLLIFYKDTMELILENRELCKKLIEEVVSRNQIRKWLEKIKNKVVNDWKKRTGVSETLLDYAFSYTIAGDFEVIKNWLANGMNESAEEITKLLEQLAPNGNNSLFSNQEVNAYSKVINR